ncbi:MAG: surface lipoprotein assembly modifier [Methylotenera sp.]|nr:surface lipoprotein assembly modifier [Methylotenera sp.]
MLTANPPEQAKINIEKYLSAIASLDNLSKTRIHAFIDYTLGFDSNINSATSSTNVAAPGLGVIFNLDSDAIKISDKFHLLTGGLDFAKPISSSFSLIGSAKVSQRINWDESQFNLANLDLNIGFAKSYKNDLWSLSLSNNDLTLDSKRFRHAYGVNGQWQHNLSNFSQLSLYGQLNRIAFPNQETRDANRAVLGAGYARVFDAKLKPLVYFGIFGGEENTIDNNFDFLGFDLFGLRLGGQVSVNPRLDLSISSSFENRQHHESDPAFLITRHDKQYDLNLGMRYLLLPTLVLSSNLGYTKNTTNYDISDYERTILTFALRKDFNW